MAWWWLGNVVLLLVVVPTVVYLLHRLERPVAEIGRYAADVRTHAADTRELLAGLPLLEQTREHSANIRGHARLYAETLSQEDEA